MDGNLRRKASSRQTCYHHDRRRGWQSDWRRRRLVEIKRFRKGNRQRVDHIATVHRGKKGVLRARDVPATPRAGLLPKGGMCLPGMPSSSRANNPGRDPLRRGTPC